DMPAADLAKITMPVLTIHGEKDRNAPNVDGREWARQLPNARFVSVPNAAHAAWADDPVIVFASIRDFLRGGWPLGAEKLR
ncbi:MAG: alpha/beta hydrolase, partial [Acidobacteria bacterium]|nr:alpha/beta hydrolase [Acidobacteriota bacterium]